MKTRYKFQRGGYDKINVLAGSENNVFYHRTYQTFTDQHGIFINIRDILYISSVFKYILGDKRSVQIFL